MRRGALTALCTAAVLGLSACGTTGQNSAENSTAAGSAPGGKGSAKPVPYADLSGPAIAEKAGKATRAASSVTVNADTRDADGHTVFEMAISRTGDCAGTLSLNDQGKATISKVGAALYLKYDEAFLRAQGEEDADSTKEQIDAVVAMLADRWIKTDPKDPDAEDFTSFCDLDELLGDLSDDTVARKGKIGEVNGQQAIALTEADGKDTYTLHVATEGEPYLLKLTGTGDEPFTMTFKDFGKPVPAKVPADKDIVDLDD
ncbi:hypothetical protein DVH02_17605 [Streptomyces corynorhini]|uniref:Lipoprotein n=1 Tax=Streptomyces corynorhini TaxID=2282652 RepID=A0A370B4W8_9ACTN|nr:hypothetical protein DVH02_17605 [Streptomyces corynorhini]